MKRILFLSLLVISLIARGADSLRVDSLGMDQLIGEEQNRAFSKVDADSAFINEDFVSAIEIYEYLLRTKGESADVYYNLGNSYFKSENLAKAILNYERAFLLRPGDQDIRFNLDLAREKTIDKVTPNNEIIFVTWFKSVANLLNADAWAKCGIASFLLLIASLSIYIFTKQISVKKVSFGGFLICLMLVLLTNIFAYYQKDRLVNRDQAIVMSPSVTVRSTPNESGTELFILHEGHKVFIKDGSMRDWKEVQLEDGNAGWVPTEVIEVI